MHKRHFPSVVANQIQDIKNKNNNKKSEAFKKSPCALENNGEIQGTSLRKSCREAWNFYDTIEMETKRASSGASQTKHCASKSTSISFMSQKPIGFNSLHSKG